MNQLIVIVLLLITLNCNSYYHNSIKLNNNIELKSKYLNNRISSRLYDTIKGIN